ncbi:hypothetical protein GJAV_G00235130 [Gymnothorax javanicus]|nr:hypothetical protein GJAV_G00235130 [Gymnothorax javanicus]
MEDTSSVALMVPHTYEQQDPGGTLGAHLQAESSQQKQATDSLIQVIEKLSKIVEKRPRRCSLSGRKRTHPPCVSVPEQENRGEGEETPSKMPKGSEWPEGGGSQEECYQLAGEAQDTSSHKTATCYQCSLCKFTSPILTELKEHLQQHAEQQIDIIHMCPECPFASRQREEIETHVVEHLSSGVGVTDCSSELQSTSEKGTEVLEEGAVGLQGSVVAGGAEASGNSGSEGEPAGKKWYSYEQYGMYRCLICSYVCGQQRMLKTHAWKHAGLVDCSYPIFEDESERPSMQVPAPAEEAIVVLASVGGSPDTLHGSSSFQIDLCPAPVDSPPKPAEEPEEMNAPKVPEAEEAVVEVQVSTEQEREQESLGLDSLLSSAQKIISCSPNCAGHVNVIVERLPGAEEPMSSKPFVMSEDAEASQRLLHEESHPVYFDEEVVIGWCHGDPEQGKPETPQDHPTDENVPPARRRTHSESLRLHSLAAEALVAMPTRTPELMKASIKSIVELSAQSPGVGPRLVEIGSAGGADGAGTALVGLELADPRKDGGSEGPAKAGISLSLLTVIEKLRERTDQNATDEDILKELQDNAQSQPGTEGASPEGNLVEFVPDSERPYRCRLCRYSSGNKGYIKQHLRVHRQRQPYQCPICEHIAQNSKDLEYHMINHCKTRMYHCKQCTETFYYKSQLRNHERDQHALEDSSSTLTSVIETTAAIEDSEEKNIDEDACCVQKIYKCDVCDYSSSTYVGVRNHRRVHNADKPYRCCSCDFATTNMNSLKSHMRRHPQEHQAVQLLEQYRCSLCGYVCSHPPSLKSHMWKHAGDQNYNYEQVNKAINEAISQSSRLVWRDCMTGASLHGLPFLPSCTSSSGTGSPSVPQKAPTVLDQACTLSTGAERVAPSSGPAVSVEVVPHVSPAGGTLVAPEKGAAQPRSSMEYCMLLFCCCICGFESPSKERLMEHMKEHEGEIISIILNKEQPTQPSPSH